MRSLISSALTLAGLSKSATPGNYEFSQSYEISMMNIMSLYLDDTTHFNNIMDHGCHCARMDPNTDDGILGGNNPLDELDEICRDWFSSRQCLNKYTGGSCFNQDYEDFTMEVNLSVSQPGNTPSNITCNTQSSEDPSKVYNDCEYDSCLVDAY